LKVAILLVSYIGVLPLEIQISSIATEW